MNSRANVFTTRGEPHHTAWISNASHHNEVGVQLTMQPCKVWDPNERTRNHHYRLTPQTKMSMWCHPRAPMPGENGAGSSPSRGSTSMTGGSAELGTRGKQSSATRRTTTSATTVRVVYWKEGGIQQKKPELHGFLRENNINIICIQETYLKEPRRLIFLSSENMTSSDVTDRLATKES